MKKFMAVIIVVLALSTNSFAVSKTVKFVAGSVSTLYGSYLINEAFIGAERTHNYDGSDKLFFGSVFLMIGNYSIFSAIYHDELVGVKIQTRF